MIMEFNNKLYELRKQKGFSQEELASRLNVSRQTVSKWEVGESTPDMEKLVAISALFEISLDNRKKAKKGLKIAGIIVGAILLVDIISFMIYVIMYGLPQ